MKKFHPFILMAAICAVTYTLIQFILTPIYTVALSDVTLKFTVLPTLIHTLLSLLEILAFALCYSLVIYTTVTRGTKTALGVVEIYVAAAILRRIGALAISLAMYGFVDKRDFINVLIPVVIETAQIFIILLASHILSNKFMKNNKVTRNTDDLEEISDIRFTKVYSSKNPLMASALVGGIMLASVNVIMRIASDISYGAPQGIAEVLVMIAYYLSDLLVCVVFYAISWIVLSKMLIRYKQKS